MSKCVTFLLLLGLIGTSMGLAYAQASNQITDVSPSSAAQGTSGLLVAFTLDTDTPPAPPAGIMPTSAMIGAISGSSVTHSSQYTVTAVFSIPSGEAIGAKDVSITFPTPGGTLVFSKTGGFTVTGGANTPPSITQQPQSQTVSVGGSVTLTVAASGTMPLSYQWQKDSSDVSGATSASFTLNSVSTSDAGSYRCVVTNDFGAAASDEAILTVSEPILFSYRVVNTGQTKCYNDSTEIMVPSPGAAFYGQDAQYAGNAPSYSLSADGLTVYDNVTGLTWMQIPDTNFDGSLTHDDKLTYQNAVAFPATLNAMNYGGYNDWRLPTVKELYSLINHSGVDLDPTATEGTTPFIDTDVFGFAYGFIGESAGSGPGGTPITERIIDSQWVTTTLYVANTEQMFGVNFADGRIKGYPVDEATGKPFHVLCVRGNTSYGVNQFVDNGDGTITDNATGLMWSQADSGSGLNWQQALAWVQTKNAENYLGYSDWRLPNVKELQSIVDYTRSANTTASAAIDPLFTCTQITNEAGQTDYPFYWTGTTHVGESPEGILVGNDANYVAFGRALGYMNGTWTDVHGAGCQRSDPKAGDPADYPTGRGPQGDAVRIYNYVRLVRDLTITSVSAAAAAKLLPDGAYVSLSGKAATSDQSDFSGFFYVEDVDRSSGIRVSVSTTVPGLARGSRVNVIGKMSTTGAGERQIVNSTVTVSGYHGELPPLGMNGRTVGGGNSGTPDEGSGQYGVTGASGLNNVGLLITTWGLVTATEVGYLQISDGGAPVLVDTSNLATIYAVGDYLVVTGISGLRRSGDDRLRLIMPRDDSDVRAL